MTEDMKIEIESKVSKFYRKQSPADFIREFCDYYVDKGIGEFAFGVNYILFKNAQLEAVENGMDHSEVKINELNMDAEEYLKHIISTSYVKNTINRHLGRRGLSAVIKSKFCIGSDLHDTLPGEPSKYFVVTVKEGVSKPKRKSESTVNKEQIIELVQRIKDMAKRVDASDFSAEEFSGYKKTVAQLEDSLNGLIKEIM
jgi:hypothetical protein